MGCSLSVDGGPGMYGDAFNDMEVARPPVSTGVYEANNKVSLFSWDGSSRPDGLFPKYHRKEVMVAGFFSAHGQRPVPRLLSPEPSTGEPV